VRLLVTGASGFVGSALVPCLVRAGHDVHCVERTPRTRKDVRVHCLDLLRGDPQTLLASLRPEGLVHLAWEATPGRFWSAAENLDWVAASLRLVRAFAAAGGQRLVVAGTCAEYDWRFFRLEEARTPLRPHSLYGTAKLALFNTLLASVAGLGLSLAWGRIFFPYGPFERPGRLFSSLVDGLLAGERVAVTDGWQQRDFLHVDDVALGFAQVLESDLEGPVNIASGVAVPVREFILTTARLLEREDLVDLGARAAQPGEPRFMVADTTRIRSIGFQPSWSLETGLADAVLRRASQSAVASVRAVG
jgi:nucleoside-diphosphate-sugar epimerase